MNLQNKVVLITGAGKGRGRALAEECAKRGAKVAVNDISPMNVEDVARGIIANGGTAKAYIEDVAKKVGAQALIKNVEDDFGKIDVLINHASVEPHISLLNMDEWDWHRTLDVNLTGAFLMMQSAGRVMKAQGSGVMICLAEEASLGQEKEAGAYWASMAGLRELSNQMNLELRPYQIRAFAAKNVNEVLALLEEG